MSDPNQSGCLFVGEGVLIAGKITLPEKIIVDGQVEGEISAREAQVGEAGKITGKLSVAVADVRGELVDTISVSETLILRSTAKVRGSITYNVLQIEQGAVIEGSLNRISEAASNRSGSGSSLSGDYSF